MAERTFRLAENIRRYRTFAFDLSTEEEVMLNDLIERDDAEGLIAFLDGHRGDPVLDEDDFAEDLDEVQRDANVLDVRNSSGEFIWL